MRCPWAIFGKRNGAVDEPNPRFKGVHARRSWGPHERFWVCSDSGTFGQGKVGIRKECVTTPRPKQLP
ncbi:hypothetical protein JTE90_023596 [Oedothorax gibbosus]|uniref:Uncharacterized protein n=1 Tax=Oedothorax gibbosus TaxID=931172 RepID=A0AAV6TES4_9ARAC|nr:hypothetical protein JTE90_023596 [Oedothorax gibbosus]